MNNDETGLFSTLHFDLLWNDFLVGKFFSGPENIKVYTLCKYLFKQHSDDIVNNPWLDCRQNIKP